jgi:hypothetical protein
MINLHGGQAWSECKQIKTLFSGAEKTADTQNPFFPRHEYPSSLFFADFKAKVVYIGGMRHLI